MVAILASVAWMLMAATLACVAFRTDWLVASARCIVSRSKIAATWADSALALSLVSWITAAPSLPICCSQADHGVTYRESKRTPCHSYEQTICLCAC